jgi:hypothetical protein
VIAAVVETSALNLSALLLGCALLLVILILRFKREMELGAGD